jgi:protein-L-isoaspartate(D-aspartate) O-methyltransferase
MANLGGPVAVSGKTPDRKASRFPLRLDQVGSTRPAAARDTLLLRPQAPLQAAERDRKVAIAPQGLGLDSAHVRMRMVDRLKLDGLQNPRVLAAFARVPRHLFVDTALVNQAYEDTSLPIGLGQTISKPSVVGAMIALLCTRPGLDPDATKPLGNCLEIGTGCGYQAALLAELARRVISIERLRDLHLKARQNLDAVRRQLPGALDVRLVYGDGMLGHAPSAPYDTIIAAAGGRNLPQAWLDQLAPGGRLVAPMDDGRGRGQVLIVVDRHPDGRLEQTSSGAVLFVPLKSGIT